ncbi:MAG: HAD-IB family hydrolase [Acidimicrobiales bacterium]|nr:HAD-IB family hydrolase [Acidimicrobiales bacterium]
MAFEENFANILHTKSDPKTITVAAFDFDGTISRGDSFWRFLFFSAPKLKVLKVGFSHFFPAFMSIFLPSKYADNAKESLVNDLFQGKTVDEAVQLGEDFAKYLVKSRLKPQTISRLRWHQLKGHEVVVVSASPALYLRPACKYLGIDNVLATEFESDAGFLTGKFKGANCRGPEKARRVAQWLEGRPKSFVWAYGNSANDSQLLAFADIGIRVDRQDISKAPKEI